MQDPDLEIRVGSSRTLDKVKEGGGWCPNNFFGGVLRASVWSKNKGGGAGPPGPSPRSATTDAIHVNTNVFKKVKMRFQEH